MKQLSYCLLIALLNMGLRLNAETHIHSGVTAQHQFSTFTTPDTPSALPEQSISRTPTPSASYSDPVAITGDFDLSFYWYDFSTQQVSNTWITSLYESIQPAGDGFTITNFMREWLNPDPSDKNFAIADLKATYDEASATFTIPGNQYLYRYKEADFEIDLSLIGVKMTDKGLQPDADLDITMRWDGRGFALSGDSKALYIGARMPTGSYGGLGICYSPTLYPWNGTMIYLVSTDTQTDGMPYTCNVWASIDGDTLALANYADCGYATAVCFTVDGARTEAIARDASLQSLSDLENNPTDLFCADIDPATGQPATDSTSGQHLLSALVSRRDNATMMFQSRWGAFFMDQLVGMYTNTYTILNFDISQPGSGINEAFIPDKTPEPVYFDLNGRQIERPTSPGIYIRHCGASATKFILR